MMRLALAPALILGVVSSTHCGFAPTPDVTGSYQLIIDTLQSSFEPSVKGIAQTSRYQGADDNAFKVFRTTGGIDFEYRPGQDLTVPQGGWPNALTSADFYYDYAAAHRDTAAAFGLLVVSHMVSLDTTYCIPSGTLWTPGVSNLPDRYNSSHVNTLPPSRAGRFTFLFLADIDTEVRKCSGYAAGVLTFILAHELGHQRAGLSHKQYPFLAYHLGSVPGGQLDLMEPSFDITFMGAHDPVFDHYDTLRTNGDTTACQSNLFNARSFFR